MSEVIKYTKTSEAGELFLGSEGAAGTDLCCTEDGIICCGETKLISTGLRFELPVGKFMMIVPRSSLGLKTDVTIPNSPGILDSDYRGELGIILRQGYPIAFFSSVFVTMSFLLLLFLSVFYLFDRAEWGIILKSIIEAFTLGFFFVSSVWATFAFSRIFGFKYKKGDRLAQIVILDYKKPEFLLVDGLSETKRGEGGFGSTGKA